MSVMGGLTGAGAAMGQIMGLTQANALLGIQPGWFWQAGGWMASGMAKGMTQLMPSAMANALGSALESVDLSGHFASAFSHPFAQFQMNIDKSLEKWRDAIGKETNKADQAASKYAKAMGLSGAQMARLRDEMIDFATNEFIGGRFNKSIEEATALMGKYASEVGRQVSVTNEQKRSLLGLSALLGDEVAVKFSSALEKFGLSTTSAGDMMTKMFNKSVKQGLDLTKYAKNVTDHLALAQKYTFKDGTKGLMDMAEMATKIKMDMGMVAQFADRVSNVSDAVNMGAQLQVLGGPFAQFSDPLRMLYGSLNDMGDFSKQFAKLTENLGSFNKDTGEFNIKSTFDRIRLREAAKIMGVDYEKLIDQVTTQARRREIEKQLPYFNNVPEEFKEWVKNNATFEGGVAGIKAKDGTFKALNKLEKADFETLVNETKSEAENIADIAEMLRGAIDKREGLDKQRDAQAAKMNASIAESNIATVEALAKDTGYLSKYIELQNSILGKQLFGDMTKPINDFIGTLGNIAMIALSLKGGRGGRGFRFRRRESGGLISPSVGHPGQEYALNGHYGQSAQPSEFVMSARATANSLPVLNYMNANPHKKFRLHSNGGLTTDNNLYGQFGGSKDKFDGDQFAAQSLFGAGSALVSKKQAEWMRAFRMKQSRLTKSLIDSTPEVGNAVTKIVDVATDVQPSVIRNFGVRDFQLLSNYGQTVKEFTKPGIKLRGDQLVRLKNAEEGIKAMGLQPDDVVKNIKSFSRAAAGKADAIDDIVKATSKNADAIDDVLKTAKSAQATAKSAQAAAKTAMAGGAKVSLKSIGGAALGGILSAGFTAWDEHEQNNFVMNRGEAFGATIGSGVLGTLGTIAGNYIGGPVLGAVLGAAGAELGEWAGRKVVQAVEGLPSEKIAKRNELLPTIKNPLGQTKFQTIQGDFRKKEWERIAEALQDGTIEDGEIPKWLREKMEAYDNTRALTKGKYKEGGIIDFISKGKFKEGSILNRIFKGKSHESGGIKYGNSEFQGGELVASKEWVENNPNTTTKIMNQENVDIQAKEPIGKQMKVSERGGSFGNNSPIKIELSPLKIDISGVINLIGAVNSSIDSEVIEKAITDNVVAQLKQRIDKLINKDFSKRDFTVKSLLPA